VSVYFQGRKLGTGKARRYCVYEN